VALVGVVVLVTLGSGKFDFNIFSTDVVGLSGHGLLGTTRSIFKGHKPEASRSALDWIHHHNGICDGAELSKVVSQLIPINVQGDTSHKYLVL
jgi:hypothetical protein